MEEKKFTFDVDKISNGYIIYYGGEKIYRQGSNDVNAFIKATLKKEMIEHVTANFPAGTAQRVVVVVGITGKVME